MNTFNKQKIILALKTGLFVLMLGFIANRIFLQNDIKQQADFFVAHLQKQNFYLFLLALLLMPLNWSLETIKWRLLIKSAEPFSQLLKSVIAGITLGFVTPARSGEFVGRVLFVAEENKTKIFYLSTVGGIAQSVATLVAGVFFVFMWSGNSFFYGVSVGVAIAFMLLFFRFDLLNRFISSSSFLNKHSLVIQEDELPDMATQLQVLLLSFVRFGVYLLQYALLLMFFGVSHNFWLMLINSGVFLVAQTFSPMLPLIDLSYRGGSALYVFADFTNTLGILSAVMMVWLINLVVPSVIGYLFILNRKFKV